MATRYPENMFGDPLPPYDPDKPGVARQQMKRGTTAGRKTCTVCRKRPKSMAEHWTAEQETHGPASTENPEAVRNLPGMRDLSESMGALMFRDRRMR